MSFHWILASINKPLNDKGDFDTLKTVDFDFWDKE